VTNPITFEVHLQSWLEGGSAPEERPFPACELSVYENRWEWAVKDVSVLVKLSHDLGMDLILVPVESDHASDLNILIVDDVSSMSDDDTITLTEKGKALLERDKE